MTASKIMMKFKFIPHSDITEQLLDQVVALKATVWPYPLDEHRRWIAANLIPDDIHLILYKDDGSDTMIGYLTLNSIKIDGQSCFGIGNVCVHHDFHGQGLGLLLMKIAEYYIITSHHDAWLLCKPNVAQFYERCGWTKFEGILVHDDNRIDCNIYTLRNYQGEMTSSLRLDRIF